MCTIIPCWDVCVELVCLIDRVNRFLDGPEMIDTDVISYPAELALEPDTFRVVWT